MSLHRRNPKRDGNEAAIFDALEAQGFAVMPISGKGIPDAVVFHRRNGRAWLVEIKQPKGTYTPAQVRWRHGWTGPAPITLRSLEDVQWFMLLACESPASHGEASE